MRLNAKQLRVLVPSEEELAKISRRPIWLVLDNVLDTYNIGGLFRLAEAVGVTEIILCGGTESPPSSRIHKAAVGTEKWVPWRYEKEIKTALIELKKKEPKIKIVAVEQDTRAVPLTELSKVSVANQPVAIVVGHETDGVSQEALKMANMIVEIPMWGVNKSLNVHVSAAIVLYKLL